MLDLFARDYPELLASGLSCSLLWRHSLMRKKRAHQGLDREWRREYEAWPDTLVALASTCRSLLAVTNHDCVWKLCFERRRWQFGPQAAALDWDSTYWDRGVLGTELSKRWVPPGSVVSLSEHELRCASPALTGCTPVLTLASALQVRVASAWPPTRARRRGCNARGGAACYRE